MVFGTQPSLVRLQFSGLIVLGVVLLNVSLTMKKPSILSAQQKIARSSINGGRNRYGNL